MCRHMVHMNNTDSNTTTCRTCQTWAAQAAGETVSRSDANQASMWGCTCDPAAAAEAVEWMDRVTR
jgi:hypothetical protein